MKNVLHSILLLSFLTGFGQDEPGQVNTATIHEKKARMYTTTFGFKGGYNRSIVKGYESTGAKTGYIGNELYGGFFADTELNEKLNFENELLVSWTNDYHFVEVPLHLKYKFTTKWNAFAGPKLDIIADNDNDPFESSYRFRNFGVSCEIGAQYHVTRWLLVETRYSKSFVNQVTDLSFDINRGKRNTFRVGAGFKF